MTENGHISWIAIRLLAAMTIAAGVVACTKEDGFRRGLWPEDGNGAHPISFSAYAGGMATKAASADGDVILGHWVDSTSTFVPGTGIGVFAFYQKAKSNGYPTDFNKNIGEPTFMYNQKVERTTTDGTTYTFEYSPKKYWPNNTNDQISFFAYAPYDETTAWEDLQLVTNLKGTKITRDYVIEDNVEDQTDFLWADPLLNVKTSDVAGTIDFAFSHLCSRLSVSAKVNEKAKSIYVTVDKVTIKGKFTTSGTLVYLPEDGSSSWTDLDGMDETNTYTPFKASYVPDPESGEPVYKTFVVGTQKQYVHGDKGFTFVLPGTQDIEMTAVVSQRSSTTDFVKSYTITNTFPAMKLQANKAYNFFLNITLTPVTFTGIVDADWSTGTETYTSPDNGNTWY